MLAAARVAIGVLAVVAPGPAGAMLFGGNANSPALRLVTRSFGARDIVLGLGTLRALDQDVDAAGWARASAASDGADAVAALVAAAPHPGVARRARRRFGRGGGHRRLPRRSRLG